MKLQGIFPALATPFDHHGDLYKIKVLHNIDKLNSINLAGYVVCGSTGETPLLSTAERLQLMEWVKAASSPEKTLIAGVGAESVHETIHLANRAAEIGFHAALVLTPFYYRNQMHRPDTQALFFRSVADKIKIPVILYNIPQVTGYDLPSETVAELSHHPNIAGLKDSSGNIPKLAETVRLVKNGVQLFLRFGCRHLARPRSRGGRRDPGDCQPPPLRLPHHLGSLSHPRIRSCPRLAGAHHPSRPVDCRQARHSRIEIRHGPERLLRRSPPPPVSAA